MKSAEKCVKKRRLRKSQRETEVNLIKSRHKSPSRYLDKRRLISKKEKIKKNRNHYLGSFIQSVCEKRTSFEPNQGTHLSKCKPCKTDLLDFTIDLCDAGSSVDDSNENVLQHSSRERKPKSNPVTDLSQDLTDIYISNEVIDLTEAICTPQIACSANKEAKPVIIDISEDDFKDDQNCKVENDEVCVIGTFVKNSNITRSESPSFISLSSKWDNLKNLISCSDKLKKKYLKKRLVLHKIDNKNISQFKKDFVKLKNNSDKDKVARVGENIYVNSPVNLPSKGLRPIIIDGSNVAFVHSNSNFSCKRLEICINYFKEKGHKVTAFVPQFRIKSHKSDNPQLLRKLERQGDVVLTPSKNIDGRNIVPYDDRFIVQTAVLKGGIIVSRDNFNDLLQENPAWAETIKYRTLAFTWVDDVLMFPKDPLGEYGPTLEDFLRFH